MVSAPERKEMTCQLYRHFGENDELLYVGISLATVVRLSQHKESPWFYQIKRVEIEQCSDRQEALAKETLAIKSENPKYNKMHSLNREKPKPLREQAAVTPTSEPDFPIDDRNFYVSEADQVILEQSAIAFFRAIMATGKEHFGHNNFGFKMDINTMLPLKDSAAKPIFGAILQEALTRASRALKPIPVEDAFV